jgi:hypothetical protein
VAGSPPITVPVVAISDTEGVLIDGRIAAGPVTLTWTATEGLFPNPVGNLISSFSSYGLAPDLSLKPDIGAPGGQIHSTYPLEQGGFATLSGTSMASPHVAGGAALLKQWDPRLAARDMAARLQNSASPHAWWGDPSLGFYDNVHRQGAGMLSLVDAALIRTLVEPSDLALGESQGGPVKRRLTIRNRDTAPVTFKLSDETALATGRNTFVPSFFLAPAAVSFSQTLVTVPGRGSATVDVTITAPSDEDLPDHGLYGGYIKLQAQGGSRAVRVPFAGFKGDYQSITVLTPTVNDFPWLAKLVGGTFTRQPAGATYTMTGDDIAFFLVHLDHQSERLKIEAFDAVTGRNLHKVSDERLLPAQQHRGRILPLRVGRHDLPRQRPGPGQVAHAAERAVRREVLAAEGAGRRGQPRSLGELDLAGDHDRAALKLDPRARLRARRRTRLPWRAALRRQRGNGGAASPRPAWRRRQTPVPAGADADAPNSQ